VHEASFGLNVVHVDSAVGAERDDFVLEAVDCDAERLLTGPVFVDCIHALLC